MDPIDELRDAVAAMRAHNDQRIAEIATTGMPRAETQIALDRANAAITAAQEHIEALNIQHAEDAARVDALETQVGRLALVGGARSRVDDGRMERYARWQGAVQNKLIDPAHVDLEFVGAYQSAYVDYLRNGDRIASLESMRVLNEALVGDNPSGGYYVEPDTSGRLVQFIYETSPVRRLANVQPATGDRLTGKVRLGQAGYGWVGETEARPATAGTSVFEWEIVKRTIYANPSASQQIIDQASIDIAGWLEGEVRRVFARAEATAFVSGSTPKRPRGFLTYPSGVPGDTVATWPFVQQVASGAAATLTSDGLKALVGSLKPDYLPNASFGFRRATETIIRQMKDGEGQYLWQPDFSAPEKGILMGYPTSAMADMPAITGGALPVVFGDFYEAYQIVDDPAGVRVLVDPYTSKPDVLFYTTRYVGGDVVNFEALALQVVSA